MKTVIWQFDIFRYYETWRARFFYAKGILIVVLSFVQLLTAPKQYELQWYVVIGWLATFSVGLTEIAVGWLLGKHLD